MCGQYPGGREIQWLPVASVLAAFTCWGNDGAKHGAFDPQVHLSLADITLDDGKHLLLLQVSIRKWNGGRLLCWLHGHGPVSSYGPPGLFAGKGVGTSPLLLTWCKTSFNSLL